MSYKLGIENFSLAGTKSKVLLLNIADQSLPNVLVYFKQDRCPQCKSFDPVFMKMIQSNKRIAYGIVNVSDQRNRNIIQMSRNSNTPITATPLIIMYSGGRPYAKFAGNRTYDKLSEFINTMMSSVGSVPAQRVAPAAQQQPQFQQPHHGYSNGRPLNTPDFNAAPNMPSGMRSNLEIDSDNTEMDIPPDIIPYNKSWLAYSDK
jgi:hypothetical protein